MVIVRLLEILIPFCVNSCTMCMYIVRTYVWEVEVLFPNATSWNEQEAKKMKNFLIYSALDSIRFDSIRWTIVEKCLYVSVHVWIRIIRTRFRFVICSHYGCGRAISATFIYVMCVCVCVLYCAVFIGKFQLNRQIFERLFNFFSYCCSQFRSFFSNNWCVFAA